MSGSARGGADVVEQEPIKCQEDPNLKFIDQSDKEEAHDYRKALPSVNGGYSAVPSGLNDQRPKDTSGYPDLLSDDTSCGFWIFRGPTLQKCVDWIKFYSCPMSSYMSQNRSAALVSGCTAG